MKNIKNDLLSKVKSFNSNIKCASLVYTSLVFYDVDNDNDKGIKHEITHELKCNYSENEYNEFINRLDFGYNYDYNENYLSGYVWLSDGSWLVVSEDTVFESQYFDYQHIVKIPKHLL